MVNLHVEECFWQYALTEVLLNTYMMTRGRDDPDNLSSLALLANLDSDIGKHEAADRIRGREK